MNILCIAGWWPLGDNATGIFIKEHVRAIRSFHEVKVIHIELRKVAWKVPRIEEEVRSEDGLPVHRIRISTPVRRFGVAQILVRTVLTKWMKKIGGHWPVDIIHVHVRTDETEQIAAATRRSTIPIVITEHNSFYHLGIRDLPASDAARVKRSIRKWFADDRIKVIMPVSADLGRTLQNDFLVPPEKIKVVPNVASEEFQPAPKPQFPPYRLLLAAVWRPPKDHDVLIQALKLMSPELRSLLWIEWAGYGPDLALIQDRCRKELPDIRIDFPGPMRKPDLARTMQRSHLFILPTRADNLPCVVLESLCCGTPVISMNVNGVPELIDGSNGVLVPPQDPHTLASALCEWMADPYRFDAASIARKALERYSRPVIARQLDEVYRSVRATNMGK